MRSRAFRYTGFMDFMDSFELDEQFARGKLIVLITHKVFTFHFLFSFSFSSNQTGTILGEG